MKRQEQYQAQRRAAAERDRLVTFAITLIDRDRLDPESAGTTAHLEAFYTRMIKRQPLEPLLPDNPFAVAWLEVTA